MSGAPLASMTGTGTASLDHVGGRFEAEARSVNHRFLKTSVRSSGPLPLLDAAVERAVKARAERGHVSVFVRFVPGPSSGGASIDAERFAAGAQVLRDLASRHEIREPTLGDVLRLPGVVTDDRQDVDTSGLLEGATAAVEAALDALVRARRREGEALRQEIERLLDAAAAHLETIEGRASEVPAAVRARLESRMAELLTGTGVEPDPAAVAREAALLADRADVREEIARLEGHLEHAREIVAGGGAVGRSLDFLVQEMHRETNTIGSKSADLDLTRTVVALKSDVERLREQVQNLE